ncbi:DUF4159 domain-containing protein [soil metagenome]
MRPTRFQPQATPAHPRCLRLILLLLLVCAPAHAQRWERHSDDRKGVPDWEVDKAMPEDVFTFVRLRYSSRWRQKWAVDYPDSDLNFSYRLQQLTSLEVDPNGKVIDLADDAIFDYPFVYMIEPGDISLSPKEVENLRRYLLNGGFLMVDDFWGYREWQALYDQLQIVFPGREPDELEIDHPIFHIVFDLKEKPQVPDIGTALQGRSMGITWEWRKAGAEEVHYYALYDDNGRMMAIICHNTDLGDGWEREGESEWYFKEFAEKKAYPMGINIVFYALTH